MRNPKIARAMFSIGYKVPKDVLINQMEQSINEINQIILEFFGNQITIFDFLRYGHYHCPSFIELLKRNKDRQTLKSHINGIANNELSKINGQKCFHCRGYKEYTWCACKDMYDNNKYNIEQWKKQYFDTIDKTPYNSYLYFFFDR